MTKPDPARLRKALEQNDKKELLNVWADQPFLALFGQDQDGVERPISVFLGSYLAIVMVLDEDKEQHLIDSVKADPDVKTFVRKVPLSELARLAYSDGATLALTGESILFHHSSLVLLGYTALLENEKGQTTYCKIKTFPLEGSANMDLAPGCVQRWTFTSDSSEERTPRVIFDDSLDWQSNPYLPALPDDAVPASGLTAQERAVFDRRAKPSLDDVPAPLDVIDDGTWPAPSPLLPEDYLTGPRQIHAMLEAFLFPIAKRLKLSVQADDEKSVRFEIQYLDEVETASGASITPLTLYSESLAPEELAALPFSLPADPGLHPFPSALKALFKRHLAWCLFAESRQIDGSFSFIAGPLRNLLSALPDNSDTRFVCNPEDQRFPYLARFRSEGQEVPVLVLGMQGDQCVCNPLEDQVLNDEMTLWKLSGAFVLPVSGLDCPAHWYTGVRLSARYMLSDARKAVSMLGLVMRNQKAA
ncbi:hypothetical protein [Marinobacter confluentis]|uniref:Uncharacterized protein n=1 Tax=Marinobacter confluentis TaxID=1697557 RepID=A0A4Z1CHA1_9GAMM|nr:hypothetical protein [Marinobacter confluentis]TGN39952.1 hypothetical protein E5Q11_06555 [Marinobacter confluentis]